MRRRKAGAAVLLAFTLAASAAAQPAERPPDVLPEEGTDVQLENPWRFSAGYTHEALSGGRAPWRLVQATLVRRVPAGAWVGEVLGAQRFGSWDAAVAGEVYRELWHGSYGSLRAQFAPTPSFLPVFETSAELYQSLPQGWEALGGYRYRGYEDVAVHAVTAGVGKYVGNWYLRERTTVLPFAGEVGVTFALAARRYGAVPDNYVEVTGGVGRGVETVAEGPVIEITRTFFVAARVQRFVSRNVGFSLLAGYSDDEFFTRTTVSAGLLTRW